MHVNISGPSLTWEHQHHAATSVSSVCPPWPVFLRWPVFALSLLLPILLAGATPLSAQTNRAPLSRAVPLDLLCGAQSAVVPPAQTIRIVAGAEPRKALFARGETVLVNAGTSQGLRAGQHFYIRRVVPDRFALRPPESKAVSVHTAGWLTIVETQADTSVATVSETCDGVAEGDYLEPLVLPSAPAELAAGEPDYPRPGQVILGDDRRQLGTTDSLMVIDRGSDHGLRAGQRLTLFRQSLDGRGPVVKIGEATVMSTHPETSLMRIGATREEIQVGDLVAIHR